MKKKYSAGGVALSMCAALLISGCAQKAPEPKQDVVAAKEVAEGEKKITLSAVEMPVRKLIDSLCDSEGLSCDMSLKPSDKYVVTFNFNGTLDSLFSAIKRQTGVEYGVVDGMVSLVNKDNVTLYEDPLKTNSKVANDITVSFKDMPLADAFKYFYNQYGFSFTYNLKYTTIAPADAQSAAPSGMPVLAKLSEPTVAKPTQKVTFFYNGNDPREALKSFLNSVDMTGVEIRDKEYRIQDYDMAMIDKSVYYNYSLSSGSSSNGQASSAATSGSSTQTTGSGSSNSALSMSVATVSVNEKHHDALEKMLQNYKSAEGKLDLSMRGYIVVEDRPSYVKRIKAIVDKEIAKEAPLAISINIVRIDLKDDYKAGVDWNAVWSKGIFGLRNLNISSSMSQYVGGGFAVSGQFKGTDQIISMLQEYGDTKIERSRTIKAKSGYLANFEATKPIPYITTSSTITGGTTGFAQGSVTPMFEEEGVTLNMLPNIDLEKKIVDLGIDVSVAEYVGDKSFDMGTNGTYTLPVVTKDKGRFAVQANIGETIVLTGFKVKRGNSNKKGMPFLSQMPVVGSLFGYQAKEDDTSEILIILKVEQLSSKGATNG